MGLRKQVTALAGQIFEVDTSVEACEEFGFYPDQKVAAFNSIEYTVIGVAPMPEETGCVEKGEKILWVAPVERKDGRVCFFPNSAKNLKPVAV